VIVIAYDGSEGAQAAADEVTNLFHGKPATVVTIWELGFEMMATSGPGLGSGFGVGHGQTAELDANLLEAARRTAEEGAGRLRAAGMNAEPLVEESDGSVARTVLAVARRVDAEAVVVGTRGRGGTKSAFLGSVSDDLVKHADRAVVVVPSASLAQHRARRLPLSR